MCTRRGRAQPPYGTVWHRTVPEGTVARYCAKCGTRRAVRGRAAGGSVRRCGAHCRMQVCAMRQGGRQTFGGSQTQRDALPFVRAGTPWGWQRQARIDDTPMTAPQSTTGVSQRRAANAVSCRGPAVQLQQQSVDAQAHADVSDVYEHREGPNARFFSILILTK